MIDDQHAFIQALNRLRKTDKEALEKDPQLHKIVDECIVYCQKTQESEDFRHLCFVVSGGYKAWFCEDIVGSYSFNTPRIIFSETLKGLSLIHI